MLTWEGARNVRLNVVMGVTLVERPWYSVTCSAAIFLPSTA
jgi:hypothetical protein